MKRLPIFCLALFIFLTPGPSAEGQAKVWRIGLFHVGLDHVPPSLEPLRQALRELGYEEGKNLHWDWRNLPDEDAARATAQQFVRDRVELIVAFENQTVRAARAATTEIPVVFLHVTDPVTDGLVASLARPGGNMTGLAGVRDLIGKQLELFRELVPRLRRVLVLTDPQDPVAKRLLAECRAAAAVLKLQLLERSASNQAELERVFAGVRRETGDGVFVVSPNLQTKFSSLMLRLATEKRLPFAAHRKEWVEQGALFSYAPDYAAVGRDAARYVDRILKGTRPADLPVEEMSRFGLVVNVRAAKALGLAIPKPALLRADQVIE